MLCVSLVWEMDRTGWSLAAATASLPRRVGSTATLQRSSLPAHRRQGLPWDGEALTLFTQNHIPTG